MPLSESDISWQMLRRVVHEWLGGTAELTEVQRLVGGSINNTLALSTSDGQRAVVKISPHRVDRAYLHEAYQLNVLRGIGLPAPRVHACKLGTLDEPYSYLLMEFLDGVDLTAARRQCDADQFDHLQMHLADLLLLLHANTSDHYTRLTDGIRHEFASWPRFFRYCYDEIWEEVQKMSLVPVKMRRQMGKMHERLDHLLAHDDGPRLTHSDLWASNVLARPDENGRWWVCGILDPNCRYGHVESELAYLELFKTVTPAFMRAYQGTRRLPNEYHSVRKPIYQLYEMINHVRLFGQEYMRPLGEVMDKVARVA